MLYRLSYAHHTTNANQPNDFHYTATEFGISINGGVSVFVSVCTVLEQPQGAT